MNLILSWKNFLLEGRKDKEWFERNKEKLVTTEVEWEDLPKYGVPEETANRMKTWPIIMKSPLGNSFYSSNNTSFNHKPDGSLRVANHWNFISKRDDKLHCVTDIPITNNKYWAIGKFNSSTKSYNIIFSEIDPAWEREQMGLEKKRLMKINYFKNPELIAKKREFKNNIDEGKITCNLQYEDGNSYSGIVSKYNGKELTIKNDDGDIIFNSKSYKEKKISVFNLYLNGKIIDDLFKINY